jgi:hypothetical protein
MIVVSVVEMDVDRLRASAIEAVRERGWDLVNEGRVGQVGDLLSFDLGYADPAGRTGNLRGRECGAATYAVVEHAVREATVGRCGEAALSAACEAVVDQLEVTGRGLRISPSDTETTVAVTVREDGRVEATKTLTRSIGDVRAAAGDAIRAFLEEGWVCVDLDPRPNLPPTAPSGSCVDPVFLDVPAGGPVRASLVLEGPVPLTATVEVSPADRSTTRISRRITTTSPPS